MSSEKFVTYATLFGPWRTLVLRELNVWMRPLCGQWSGTFGCPRPDIIDRKLMAAMGTVRKLPMNSANVGNTEWNRAFGDFEAQALWKTWPVSDLKFFKKCEVFPIKMTFQNSAGFAKVNRNWKKSTP
jgi:hypothetical protein